MLRTDLALRTAAMGCRMQPAMATPASFHTSASSTCTAPSRASDTRASRKRPVAVNSRNLKSPLSMARHASSAAASLGAASPTASLLDWNTFFKLRKTRRRLQLGTSIGTSALGMVGGAQGLVMADMDAIVSQIPLDPFVTLGLITFSCGGLGWLIGPVLGTGLFNMSHSKTKGEMIVKEKEFYERVKRYRVDPSASSMANPVPDYYGEKVSSVQGYRQWLKDQRAFNKKRQTFVK